VKTQAKTGTRAEDNDFMEGGEVLEGGEAMEEDEAMISNALTEAETLLAAMDTAQSANDEEVVVTNAKLQNKDANTFEQAENQKLAP